MTRLRFVQQWVRRRLYSDECPSHFFRQELQRRISADSRVLDVGCGAEAPLLRELTGRRFGVDPTARPLADSALFVFSGSANALPFLDNSFDLVYCRSVIEHLPQPESFFREASRVLRSGSSLIFLTPNRWDYVSMGASLVPNRWHPTIVNKMTGRAEHDTFPTHYRANSGRDVRRLARDASLQLETLQLLREHPHYLKSNAALYAAGIVIEQAVQRPFQLLRPWIYAELRKP